MESRSEYHHHHHDRKQQHRRAILRWVFHRCSKFALVVALAVVALLPIAWGGGQAWWFPTALLSLVCSMAIWLVGIWWMGDGTYRLEFSWGILLFACPMLFGGFQALPLDRLVGLLSRGAKRYWSDGGSFPWGERAASLSLFPDATLRRCGLYLCCLILFLVISSLARHRKYLLWTLVAVVAAAFGNAARYYVQIFTENDEMRRLTGIFLNRNHFGFMMTMGIMATSGLLVIVSQRTAREVFDSRNRVQNDYEHPQGVLFLLTFLLLLQVVAQALCLSRAAFLTSTIGLVAFWVNFLLRRWASHDFSEDAKGHHHHHRRQRSLWERLSSRFSHQSHNRQLVIACVLLLGALGVAMPWILAALSERYKQLLSIEGLDAEGRLRVWCVSVRLFREFWLFGCGLGGYGVAIQPLEDGSFPQALIGHAHNDFLESACELGLPLMIFLVGLGGFLWFKCLRAVRRQQDVVYRWGGMAALVALASCLAHELVEYSLQAWPNAFCFTALLGVAAACLRISVHSRSSKKSANPQLAVAADRLAPGAVQENSVADAQVAVSAPEIFVDPEEAERRMRFQERHRHHEAFRANRFKGRLGYLIAALLLLAANLPVLLVNFSSSLNTTRLQHAWRALQEEERRFQMGSNVAAYERLLRRANAALSHWNSRRTKILTMRAEILLRQANLTEMQVLNTGANGTAAQTAGQLRAQALDSLAEALRRVPGEGDYVFQYARLYEKMVDARQIAASRDEVIRIFEWGLSRQPGVVNNVRELGDVYARAWLWALRNRQFAASVEYRKKAIENYLRSLDLTSSKAVLAALRLLRVPLDEILTHIPQSEEQLKFFATLVDNQDYATAGKLLQRLGTTSPDPEKYSDAEWRLKLAEAHLLLGEMGQKNDERQRGWLEYRAADQSFEDSQLIIYQELISKNENWAANELLRKLSRRAWPGHRIALLRSRQLRVQGRPDDAMLALLPLAYSYESPTADELSEALKFLGELTSQLSASPAMQLCHSFLVDALSIRQDGLRGGDLRPEDRTLLVERVERLEELDAVVEATGKTHWLQDHLLAYYAGLGYEVLGEPAAAIAAYRRSLAKCPRFLWGILRLGKLIPNELSSEEAKLFKWSRRFETPVGNLEHGLDWLDVECTPARLSELHDTMRCTVALLCTDDLYAPQEKRLVFRDCHGVLFYKPLIERSTIRRLLVTRVGELLLFDIALQPVVDAASMAHRRPANGALVAQIGEFRTPVLEIRLP